MRRFITSALCVLLWLNTAVNETLAAVSFELESSGKTEAAALGNLRMAALRKCVQQTLSPTEIKQNARLLRSEIFLKVGDLTEVQGKPDYRTENQMVFVRGQVSVDDAAIAAIVGRLPLKHPAHSPAPAAPQPATAGTATSQDTLPETAAAGSENPPAAEAPAVAAADTNGQSDQDAEPQPEAASAGTADPAPGNSAADPAPAVTPGALPETTVSGTAAAPREIHTTIEEDSAFISLVQDPKTTPAQIIAALEQGANPNAEKYLSGSEERTLELPLLYSYVSKHLSDPPEQTLAVIRAFSEAGADINRTTPAKNGKGMHSLAGLICRDGSPALAEGFLELRPNLHDIKVSLSGRTYGSLALAHLKDLKGRLKKVKDLDQTQHLRRFEQYLDAGCDPNEVYQDLSDSGSILGYALTVHLTEPGIMGAGYYQALLRHGASADSPVHIASLTDAQTALYIALQYNHAQCIQDLIAAGADVNRPTVGATPVSPLYFYLAQFFVPPGGFAVKLYKEPFAAETAKALITAGADVSFITSDGKDSVVQAAFRSADEGLEREVLSRGPDLKKCAPMLPFRWLAGKDQSAAHLEIFTKMLNLGIAPDASDGHRSLLEAAMEHGNAAYTSLVLERGADPNTRGGSHKTPLFYKAMAQNNAELLTALAEHGADFSLTGEGRDSVPVLYKAADDHRVGPECIEALLKGGADPNYVNPDKDNFTPLLAAIASRDADEGLEAVVDLLLKHKADPRAASQKIGLTALMLAARRGQDGVIGLLTAAGADPNAADKDGATALSYAVISKSEPCVRALMDKGGDIGKALDISTKKKGQVVTLREMLKTSYAEAQAKGKVSDKDQAFYEFLEPYL